MVTINGFAEMAVERTLLKNLIFMAKLEKVAPETTFAKVTDDEVEENIKSLVVQPVDGYEPDIIERALGGLKMSADIHGPDAHVTTFCSEFFERMDGIGSSEFRADNPKQMIAPMLSKVELMR